MPPRSLSDRSPVSVLVTNWDNNNNNQSKENDNSGNNNKKSYSRSNSDSSIEDVGEEHDQQQQEVTVDITCLHNEKQESKKKKKSGQARPNSNRSTPIIATNNMVVVRKKSNLSMPSVNGVRKEKRNIVFAKTDLLHPVPHLDDMTPEEVTAIWYDPKEYSEIKSSYQITIVKMEAALESTDPKNQFEENEEQTFRGLEYRTQTGAWARYENKRDAYNAVLDEQDRQWKQDKDDDEALSRVYIEHSAKCVQAAYQRGVEDAATAKQICASLFHRHKSKKPTSNRNRTTSPSSSSNHKTSSSSRSGSRSNSGGLGSRSDSEESKESTERSAEFRNTGKVKQLLREQSFSRRNQVRDDINNMQQQQKTSKSSSSRSRSSSPKKDRSLSPKTRSTSPKSGSKSKSSSNGGTVKVISV